MVEPPRELTVPRRPRPPRRRGPSPVVRWTQRLLALGLLAAAGLSAWYLVDRATRSTHKAAPPPTTAAALPQPKPLRIVFPEGFTRAEMAQRVTAVDKIAVARRGVHPRLAAASYLAATRSWLTPRWFESKRTRRPLEGFLFPATYDFSRATTSAQLVAEQLGAFRHTWAGVDLAYAHSKNLTSYDVLTIASMIEREAVVDSERPLIAAVIYNRLHARMPLGIDATIRYALHVPGTQPLRESQLKNPTPYNTRLHTGLPPTPIANPGAASLRAAAHPARVTYLYFAAKKDKRHHAFFTSASAFEKWAAANGYGPH